MFVELSEDKNGEVMWWGGDSLLCGADANSCFGSNNLPQQLLSLIFVAQSPEYFCLKSWGFQKLLEVELVNFAQWFWL